MELKPVTEHKLPALPYPYDALEPYIDEQTMRIHHDKHHQTYVDKLNAALASHKELQGKPVESLLKDLEKIPADIKGAVRGAKLKFPNPADLKMELPANLDWSL